MSPHPALEAGPGDRHWDLAVLQQPFHTAGPAMGVVQIKPAGCAHRAAWPEARIPLRALGYPLQPPTLRYKSQGDLAQGLGCWSWSITSHPGECERRWWGSSLGLRWFLPQCSVGHCYRSKKHCPVWAHCWVGINFVCLTGCTTALKTL